MPTGYTAQLEEMKYDVKRWLKESVVRAFGVCMELRDEGRMTQKDLMNFFKGARHKESFYEQMLRESKENLTKIMNRTPIDWEREYSATRLKEKAEYEEAVVRHQEKKAGHAKSIAKVADLYHKAVKTNQEELIVNSLKFALDQLNMVYDSDCNYEPSVPAIIDQSAIEWQRWVVKSAHEDIVRYSKYVEEEATERHKSGSAAASYEKLVKFVDKNCE